MKVKIKRQCTAQGTALVQGETYDLPDHIARALCTMGRAESVGKGEKADEPIAVRDPQLQSRDPQIAIGDVGTESLVAKKRGK